jgi:hypothetical protein
VKDWGGGYEDVKYKSQFMKVHRGLLVVVGGGGSDGGGGFLGQDLTRQSRLDYNL